MFKTVLRLLGCCVLCVLLVYAPEIYTAVSAPYAQALPQRVLLRVSLCAPDAQEEKTILHALQLYMKESPETHLRIISPPADRQFSQPAPQADLFIFPAHAHSPFPFLYIERSAVTCFAVHPDTAHPDAARSLLLHLAASAGLDSTPSSTL